MFFRDARPAVGNRENDFAVFLRIGAVTFGGGFVMIPEIQAEVVNSHHWLTHQEFADATALGQITPGPVLIMATFVGYRVAGTLGALLATICVFLPSFLMTIAAGSSFRRSRAAGPMSAGKRSPSKLAMMRCRCQRW